MPRTKAKAPLKTLIQKAEMTLGLLCTEWRKAGLTSKQILRKAKPYTDAIREAREELGRGQPIGKN